MKIELKPATAKSPGEGEPCNPPCVWLKVVFDGGLGDAPAMLDSWPDHAEWLDYEMEWGGLQVLIGDSDGTEWWEWMLRNGIAPGQEFWARVEQPTYSWDYWGEHDVEYGDWEIARREPIPDDRAGRLWLAWFKDLDCRKIMNMDL
jgi:hypothetical protein